MSDNNKYDTMPFPFDSPSPLPVESDGLKVDLRDYFASHASDSDVKRWMEIYSFNGTPITEEQAKYAYADVMLATRQKERG